MIYWYTGQPGAGKTTLAEAMAEIHGGVVVDGDVLRKVAPAAYDENGRRANIDRGHLIARYLDAVGLNAWVALVSPYRDQRERFKAQGRMFEIYLHTDEVRGKERYHVEGYEPPKSMYMDLDTGKASVAECVGRMAMLVEKGCCPDE